MKLRPGTPSMSAGSTMPCQWIELVDGSELRTRSVTLSPWRQRNVGAGRLPLTTVALRGAPVKLTGSMPMSRSNCAPDSSGTRVRTGCAIAARPSPNAAAVPPSASPCTNRRRDRDA
jgi:hypothetical protein